MFYFLSCNEIYNWWSRIRSQLISRFPILSRGYEILKMFFFWVSMYEWKNPVSTKPPETNLCDFFALLEMKLELFLPVSATPPCSKQSYIKMLECNKHFTEDFVGDAVPLSIWLASLVNLITVSFPISPFFLELSNLSISLFSKTETPLMFCYFCIFTPTIPIIK